MKFIHPGKKGLAEGNAFMAGEVIKDEHLQPGGA